MKIAVKEVAAILSVSEDQVYRWIRDKAIPCTRVHEQYRFNRAEILEWATSRGMPTSIALFPDSPNGAPMPALADALERGGTHSGVAGRDREGVLHEVVRRIPLPESVDRDLLVDVLLAREALGSTGVGDGIAIPHVRNPVVLNVPSPLVALCFLESPVDFLAIDGRPVTTLFTLVSSTIRAHLHLLARLSAAVHDAAFKKALLSRAPASAILAEVRRVEEALTRGTKK
jgi:PTS system nitrogen regulatory IIA component